MAQHMGKRRPTERQVAAWLRTVIGPIADALAVEAQRARPRDWSFRAGSRETEFFWRVERMVATPFHPNLRHLWRFQPE